MKIIISGTSGIGKTTLCRDLADKLSIPYLEENYSDIINARKLVVQKLESNDPSQAKKAFEHYEATCFNWIKRRIEWRRNHENYIADRCTIDLLYTWISSRFSVDRSQMLNLLIKACADEISQVNLAVIPPLTQLAKEETHNESSLPRSNNTGKRLKAHSSIIGLLHIFQVGDKLLMLKRTPGKQDSREQRVMDVIHWLEKAGHSPLPKVAQDPGQPL